jgi:hypothetical protein
MKCAYCGKNNKAGAIICKRCGIALPIEPPPAKKDGAPGEAPAQNDFARTDGEKRKADLKKYSVPAAIAAALVAAIILIALAFSGSGVTLPSGKSYSVLGGDALRVLYNGEDVCPAGFKAVGADVSLNGRSLALMTDRGALFAGYKGGMNAVENSAIDHVLSADGTTLVYRDINGLLWSYDIKGGKSAPVCVSSEPVAAGYAVSPDGDSVIFNKLTDLKLCLYTGKNIRELGDNLTPISVSNGGRHIYAYSVDENALYYLNKKGRATYLRSNLIGGIELDREHEEIVFSFESGPSIIITMISVKGGEPVEILNSSDTVYPVMPVSAYVMTENASGRSVNTCPYKTFDGKVFAGAKLLRYGAKGVTVLEPSYCDNALVSDDMRSVLYLNAGGLSKRKLTGSDPAERVLDKCAAFLASTNLKNIWYTLDDGSFHYLSGAKDVLICPAVVKDFAITDNGRSAVFSVSGNLFSNKNGNPKTSYQYADVKVAGVSSVGNTLYILTDNGWEKLPGGGKKIDLTK